MSEAPSNSKNRPNFTQLLISKNLKKKYFTSKDYYHSRVTADIMYNEPRRLVSIFKDYLIYDDFSEYLKREYTLSESKDRLVKIFEFYERYSKVFPNYVSIPLEGRYMFKNIERKQKLIDQIEKRKAKTAEEKA